MIKESLNLLIITFLFFLIFFLLNFKILSFIFFILIIFILYFFRDPKREIIIKENQVLAPADGRVVEIKEFSLGTDKFTKVSIFLSIFDVHINRAPVSGLIKKREYKKGQFNFAFRKNASELNESNIVFIQSGEKEIILKQIAGMIARRIIFWKKEGEVVKAGEKIGMIKFGSRVELIIPGDLKLYIKNKDKVKAGTTIIAEWII